MDALQALERIQKNKRQGNPVMHCAPCTDYNCCDNAGFNQDIETIKAALDASGWEPIEVAPRDTTPILGWSERWDYPELIQWVDTYTHDMCWHFYNVDLPVPHSAGMQPTHWMFLPQPPTKKEG